VTGSRLGVSVATISEKVNVDFWDLELVGDIEKVEKVVDVRVLQMLVGRCDSFRFIRTTPPSLTRPSK